MRSERSEPILPALNLDETRAFYEKLGFVAWWKGRGTFEYEIVSRGHLVIHFFAEPELTPGKNETAISASEGCRPVPSGLRQAQPPIGRHPSADRTSRSAVGDARVHAGRSVR